MDKPRFKNKVLHEYLIEQGNCYTVKKAVESKLPHLSQRVVFAIEVDKEMMSDLRDISPKLVFDTTKGKSIKLVEGTVVTTSSDLYGSVDKFLNFYVDTDEKISEAWIEFSSEKQSNKSQNKQSMPKRRKLK